METYFLDKNQQKLIKLLVYMFEDSKTFYFNAEVIKILGVSATKLNEIYYQMEVLSKSNRGFKFDIISKGCEVEFLSDFSISKIYSDFLKSTCNFKIIEELFYGNFINLELFATSQHMSVRTVQRSIQKLKIFLSYYDTSLNFLKKDILNGQEFIIRFFFERLKWEVFDEQEFLDFLDKDLNSKILFNSLKEKLVNLSMPDVYRMVNIVRFTAMRIKQNYYIGNVPEVLQYKNNNNWMEFDTFSLEIVGPYLKKYQKDNNIQISKETEFLYEAIGLLVSQPINTQEMEGFLEIKTYFKTLLENILKRTLSVEDSNYVISGFESYLSRFLVFRTNHVINPILSIEKYENTIDNFQVITKFLLKKCAVKYLQWETVLLDKLFMYRISLMLRGVLLKYVAPLKVSLISKKGNLEKLFLQREIESIIGSNIIFEQPNEHTDFIIADFPLQVIKYESNIIYYWSDISHNRNKINLLNIIDKIQKNKIANLIDVDNKIK